MGCRKTLDAEDQLVFYPSVTLETARQWDGRTIWIIQQRAGVLKAIQLLPSF
jgi:predicted RNA-binding protein YlxR (DUF448 family)